MKIIFTLVISILSVSAFAGGPIGNLSQWKGRYETVNCIQCPDHKVDSGANLKNFIRFAFGYGQIDPKDKLSCSQTDVWIGMDFVIQSDDKNITDSVGFSSGQCDWNEKFGESLVATDDSLIYQSYSFNKKMLLTLKKAVEPNTYILHQVIHRDYTSWGYPNDWEYRVEIRKIDLNP